MNPSSKRFLEFGAFRMDADERRLFREGTEITLTPKVFDLLEALVEKAGHTITKDELLERIWGETIVEENSLTRNISILRKTLGDDPVTGSYIRTVPRRGYRFEAELHVVVEDEEELIVERRTNYSLTLQDRKEDSSSLPAVRRATIGIAGLSTLAIVILTVAAIGFYTGSEPARSAAASGDDATDPQALDLYRRGRQLWQTRRGTDLHEATLLLEQAVDKDPRFAPAHAALADAYAFDLGNWRKAETSASNAIVLDPTLGEPYASMGFVELFWKWKPAAAEQHFRKAIILSPNYAPAHQWYAIKLAIEGNFNAALAEISRAVELEPASAAINADLCQVLYFLQRFDEAEVQCVKTLSIDPENFSAHSHLHDIYIAQGRYAEAVDWFVKGEQLAVNNATLPHQLSSLRVTFECEGIRGFLRARLAAYGPEARGLGVARWYALLGDNESALRALIRSYEQRDFELPFAFSDPMILRCCSGDQRFIGLREMWLEQRE